MQLGVTRFNLFMFTEEDDATINNEDRNKFYIRKIVKIYSFL